MMRYPAIVVRRWLLLGGEVIVAVVCAAFATSLVFPHLYDPFTGWWPFILGKSIIFVCAAAVPIYRIMAWNNRMCERGDEQRWLICPACNYDLRHAQATGELRTCPECGFSATRREIVGSWKQAFPGSVPAVLLEPAEHESTGGSSPSERSQSSSAKQDRRDT